MEKELPEFHWFMPLSSQWPSSFPVRFFLSRRKGILIHEATLNWRRVDQRALLARYFEHGKMKAASDKQRGECNRRIQSNPPPVPGRELDCIRDLLRVADTFSQAQQQRYTAGYDNSKQWTRTDVLTQIELVKGAFESWHRIRKEANAQAYPISLFGTSKGA